MKKSLKLCSIIILTILYSLAHISYYPKAFSELNLKENSANNNTLPHHFRMISAETNLAKNQDINLKGLDKLNISGSGQFSESGLSLIKNSIPNKFSIIDVDLRQESHGFINGIAVSWENSNNSANKGLSLPEVLSVENKLLESIKIGTPITFYNTKDTVIPESVQNEEELAKSKGMQYIRIPVTDGNLPTDDMVKYFIDFVSKLPNDTWLHFHCKEGIGRTTTFMIMYDIMKNYKDVSLDDIIKRQVVLSTISDKSAQDFYTGNHFKFLSDFYNSYTAKNTYSMNYQNSINSLNDYYIKNCILPKYLYVISDTDMNKEEQTMISALQGIISSKSDFQIYILPSNQPDYKLWLDDLNKNYNISYENISDPWKLLNIFKHNINGYILYSNSNPYSINNACSLASLKNSLPIDESLESKVQNYEITNLIEDCRNTDKHWAYKSLWNSGLNHTTVIELSPEKSMALRDYAIMSKSLIFYEYDINDFSLRKDIFSSMDDIARCLGWGPDEFNNVSIASKYGVDTIAADWSYNLSVLSSFPINVQTQKHHNDVPAEDNIHYVTFIMSDGDNQQWLLGSNYSSEKWYGSKNRGNFNLGWTLSPSLYYLAPTVFNKYYESASSSKYSDYYIVSPSGNGYIYHSKFPKTKLDSYTQRLNNYMKQVDQKYVLIIDDNALYDNSLWDKYTSCPNIEGLFYLDYKKNNNYEGKIVWSNDKPIVSCRDLLWNNLEDEKELIKNINSRVELGYTNIKTPESYTFVYVHVWSKTMDDVQHVVDKLNNNPQVRIVNPDIFMKLIKNNILATY
ncbi:GxGYxYP domain-containing protein [Clostridium tertium]|jgi:protein-tyrosine phosphatase|uniref:GxGYxYP domain-containing protein n=1 Tax=Clostridium tertium TaxID=1559 RepID=UPI002330CE7F|nr:GxGYxYP domain-containing protein [Clostridium tertium]MDB1940200.1 GxGYxYP family putative glycoside hydrolase [Clostridium tertium]